MSFMHTCLHAGVRVEWSSLEMHTASLDSFVIDLNTVHNAKTTASAALHQMTWKWELVLRVSTACDSMANGCVQNARGESTRNEKFKMENRFGERHWQWMIADLIGRCTRLQSMANTQSHVQTIGNYWTGKMSLNGCAAHNFWPFLIIIASDIDATPSVQTWIEYRTMTLIKEMNEIVFVQFLPPPDRLNRLLLNA